MKQMLTLEQLNNVAEIDIVYRRPVACKMVDRPKVLQSSDAYLLFLHYWSPDRIELLEECKVLFLNNANDAMQVLSLSQGGMTDTVVDIRLILAAALKVGASSIILCHNHPSGNVTPSRADTILTDKLKCAALYHTITLVEHIILTPTGYYSFADEGLL